MIAGIGPISPNDWIITGGSRPGEDAEPEPQDKEKDDETDYDT